MLLAIIGPFGCWVVLLFCFCAVELLCCWIFGLLVDAFVGFLTCWLMHLLGFWLVG